MQQFILIRGHQGSGKSTFAKQKITDFLNQYPNAQIIHLENDILLTDEQGVYHWSPSLVDKAQQKNLATFKEKLKYGQQNRSQDILIINSNTNQKLSGCIHLIKMAKKFGFETQVFRLHNFFENTHNVKQSDVLSAYINLNNNKLRDEIDIDPIKTISDELKKQLEKMQNFAQKPLLFDQQKNTYVTDDYLNFAQKNFIKKASKKYPNLFVLKYARHIFYDNKFDDALLEMRGLVMDNFNQIIIRPFKKVFNYSERIAKNSKYPINIDDTHLVNAVVKVNGFLGVCTYVSLEKDNPNYHADFNQKVLYSTTGSLDSDFAKMTQIHCEKYTDVFKKYPNHSFLFEITDKDDIHIINEAFGETLIGIVDVKTGQMFDEDYLDNIGKQFNINRPQVIKNITFGELKHLLKTVKHEGFMVFDANTDELLFKLKSPFYLISKFFGRSKESNLNSKLHKKNVDEEYYPLIDYIKDNQDYFNNLDELAKIAYIQEFLEKL